MRGSGVRVTQAAPDFAHMRDKAGNTAGVRPMSRELRAASQASLQKGKTIATPNSSRRMAVHCPRHWPERAAPFVARVVGADRHAFRPLGCLVFPGSGAHPAKRS